MKLKLKLLYHISFSKPEFVLMVDDGKVETAFGGVSNRFVRDVQDIISTSGVREGLIIGQEGRRRTNLIFTDEIPRDARQGIRNIWSFYN